MRKSEIDNGNGAPMRISPVVYAFDTLKDVLNETRKATIPSHNSVEAIIGAQSIVACIFLARTGYLKEDIKKYIEMKFGYNLNLDIEYLRKNYKFKSNCTDSVPQAIFTFLISNNL